MTRTGSQLKRLAATIERLAEGPGDQRAYLSHLGTPGLADELALEFDDALRPVRHQLDVLGVPASVVAKIDALDDALSAMSGAEREWLWRPRALDGPEWRNVRQMAAEISREFAGPDGQASA